MTEATQQALCGLRDLSMIQWYVIPLMAIVFYVYTREIKEARKTRRLFCHSGHQPQKHAGQIDGGRRHLRRAGDHEHPGARFLGMGVLMPCAGQSRPAKKGR